MIDYTDSRGNPCNMIDECYPPANEKEAYDLLSTNFERHYTTNRAPFPMFLHAGWFAKYPYTLTGKDTKILSGLMPVSGQLRTYPSPNPTTVNRKQFRVKVEFREGYVRSCICTDFNPDITLFVFIEVFECRKIKP